MSFAARSNETSRDLPAAGTLFRLAGRLPLRVLHRLGAALGWAVWLSSPTYRRHLRENLAAAFPDAPAGLARSAIAHAGRAIAELPRVWRGPREDTLALVREVIGWDLVEAARRRGEGIVFLTPHLGCFEISARYYACFAPITVLYRPPKRRALARLVEQARAGGNLRLARADLGGVRELLRALKRHEAIGMLPDQVPGGGEGVWAEFFNRPAYTMTLAARLAAVGATLLLAHAERLPAGAGFRLALRAPGPLPPGPPAVQAAAINRMLESLIRSCPQQYLWGYNRYKRPAGAPEPAGAAPGAGDRRC